MNKIDVLLCGTPSVNKELKNELDKESMGTSMQIEVLKDIYNYIIAREIKQSLDESEE